MTDHDKDQVQLRAQARAVADYRLMRFVVGGGVVVLVLAASTILQGSGGSSPWVWLMLALDVVLLLILLHIKRVAALELGVANPDTWPRGPRPPTSP